MISALKEWVLILFLTSFIGTLANILSPDNANMKKYIKFACAIVAAAIMIMPIKNLFADIPSIYTRYAENFETTGFYGNTEEYVKSAEIKSADEWIITKTVDALQSGINNTIYSKYGINSKNIYINIKERDKDLNSKSNIVVVEAITVEIAGEDILTHYEYDEDSREIETFRKEIEDYLRYLAEFDINVKIV